MLKYRTLLVPYQLAKEREVGALSNNCFVKEFDSADMVALWSSIDTVNFPERALMSALGNTLASDDFTLAEAVEWLKKSEKGLSMLTECNRFPEFENLDLGNPRLRLPRFTTEEAKVHADSLRIIRETILKNVCFSTLKNNAKSSEKVFYSSLGFRLEELRRAICILDMIEVLSVQDLGKIWWTGSYDGNPNEPIARLRPVHPTEKAPELMEEIYSLPMGKYFAKERLNGGKSIFSKSEQWRLRSKTFSAKEIQTQFILAETKLFSTARKQGLPEGDYRFPCYLKSMKSPAISVDEESRIIVPDDTRLNSLELLGKIDSFINCEARCNLATRELFYTALGDGKEAQIMRPLVPVVARSMNSLMLNGLKLFSRMKILGSRALDTETALRPLRAVSQWVLDPVVQQPVENVVDVLRYSTLSAQEMKWILRAESSEGLKPFSKDYFPSWPMLKHTPFELDFSADICLDPFGLVAHELLGV